MSAKERVERNQSASRIRAIRRKLGLTQQELADLLHTTQVTIARWETGACIPRKSALEALAKVGKTSGAFIYQPPSPEHMEAAIQFLHTKVWKYLADIPPDTAEKHVRLTLHALEQTATYVLPRKR